MKNTIIGVAIGIYVALLAFNLWFLFGMLGRVSNIEAFLTKVTQQSQSTPTTTVTETK